MINPFSRRRSPQSGHGLEALTELVVPLGLAVRRQVLLAPDGEDTAWHCTVGVGARLKQAAIQSTAPMQEILALIRIGLALSRPPPQTFDIPVQIQMQPAVVWA